MESFGELRWKIQLKSMDRKGDKERKTGSSKNFALRVSKRWDKAWVIIYFSFICYREALFSDVIVLVHTEKSML
jgi:hypothetical protein